MKINYLKAGMVLDHMYNSLLGKDSKYLMTKHLLFVGSNIVVYTLKPKGKEFYASSNEVECWSDFKVRN